MKLQARQIPAFLKSPPAEVRAILVYGPEESLMRERATALGKTVVETLSDPFNVSVLQGPEIASDPGRLLDEARAISMFGGRRLLRLENASDKNTVTLKAYLADADENALVIVEAGNLGPKSSLRKLFETAENAAALPCYVEDDRSLVSLLQALFSEKKQQIRPDAALFLAQTLAGDRGRLRSEVEKISLYKGTDASPVTLEEAQKCCGDSATRTFDDLCFALSARDGLRTQQALDLLQADGVSPVALLRVLMNHFRRLHLTKTRTEAGESLESAMNTLQPRVFFKYEDAFCNHVSRWPLDSLSRVLLRLLEIESRSKISSGSVWPLMARTMLEICGSLKKAM